MKTLFLLFCQNCYIIAAVCYLSHKAQVCHYYLNVVSAAYYNNVIVVILMIVIILILFN